MAIYHLHHQYISRAEGRSATACAAYRAAAKIHDEQLGQTFDYTRRSGVYQTEILAPANAPDWVFDREKLWNACEKADNRKNSRTAHEFDIALPTELSHEQKIALVRSFCQKEFVWKGVVVDVAYHDFQGKNAHNPHAHVMLPTRFLENDKLGGKQREWEHKQQLTLWRKAWAEHVNQALAQAGLDVRIDHRSFKDQGIENRLPTKHEGVEITGIKKRGEIPQSEVYQTNERRKALNSELDRLEEALKIEQAKEAWHEKRRQERVAKAAEQDNVAQPLYPLPSDPASAAIANARTAGIEQPPPILQPALQQTTEAVWLGTTQGVLHETSRSGDSTPGAGNAERSAALPATPKGRDPREPRDTTWRLVKRQLDAMGGNGSFEVGILERDVPVRDKRGKGEEGKTRDVMSNRVWHRDEILRYDPETGRMPILSYLKAQNAAGKDIYIRPAPTPDGKQQGLVLVDDIDPATVADLKDKGLSPTVVVETSHKNCQAWVRVTDDTLSREEATHLARWLAAEAGGDKASASFQHYGRLAGFTNRKEKHFDPYRGRYPYVKLVESSGTTAQDGQSWLAQAREAIARTKAEQEQLQHLQIQQTPKTASEREKQQAAETFASLFQEGRDKHGIKDTSSLDWVVSKRMAKRGWSAECIRHAIVSASPDLDKRKPGHQDDYAQRTVTKIFEQPDVLEALAQKSKRQQTRQPKPEPKPQREQLEQELAEAKAELAREQNHEPPHPPEDERERIEQWQEHFERERGKPDADGSVMRPTHPPGERESPSSGHGTKPTWELAQGYRPPRKDTTDPSTAEIRNITHTAQPIGDLDAETASILKSAAHASKNARMQLRKADWLLENPDLIESKYSHWNPCKREYLKELARIRRAHGMDTALDPHTDVAIACKLRLAGFSRNQINKALVEASPIATSLPSTEHQTVYLEKAIKPALQSSKLREARTHFWQERQRHAETITDPAQQEAARE